LDPLRRFVPHRPAGNFNMVSSLPQCLKPILNFLLERANESQISSNARVGDQRTSLLGTLVLNFFAEAGKLGSARVDITVFLCDGSVQLS
jgi:hypothetical protein